MKVYDLRRGIEYTFECNINKDEYLSLKKDEVIDDWGTAFVWYDRGDIGVEYNFCIDWTWKEPSNCSAIYKMTTDNEGYMRTDYSTFIHYEIDFSNENWESELEKAMVDAMCEMFDLGIITNQEE